MPVRRDKVDECVEALCRQGCSMVYRYINVLQQNGEFPEVAGLSAAERMTVLAELVAIMAIYDGSCES
jgi:ABC-type ATPase with predicted acetyltransferase domain